MSTFDGLVREFPKIRIDYFRHHADQPAPAALFLSHVHSDHLMGLEAVKMPFVYCSSITRRILLKMEKYPHRINYARGILEARKQHYKHLKTVLRAIPMSTATELELGPKSSIRVTLLDANHCPGAVMFLIEGDGKAILYTGDVRAESWWVNSIVQNPVLLPYTCGLRHLDCIYLDTTFATQDEPYRDFPTKAEGLRELLDQISRCPPDTIFYFRAWTLGYESVWIALSNFLQSKIHVNQYQLGIFGDDGDNESAALTGFKLGNRQLSGCLTDDESARIHSCEPGLPCHSKVKRLKNVVWITPIISRLKDGSEIRELGAGGGWKDLYPTAQFRLEESVTVQQLLTLCAPLVSDKGAGAKVMQMLGKSVSIQDLYLTLNKSEEVKVENDSSLRPEEFVALLSKILGQGKPSDPTDALLDQLPKPEIHINDTIHFPYSRHSSYNELRHLVNEFQPRDICPCTVCPEAWSEELSMEALFGDLCSEQTFYHDQETRDLVAEVEERRGWNNGPRGKRKREDDDGDSQKTQSQHTHCYDPSSPVVFTSPIKAIEPRETNGYVKEENSRFGPSPYSFKGEVAFLERNQEQDEDFSHGDLDSQPLSSSAFESQSEKDVDLVSGRSEHLDAQMEGRAQELLKQGFFDKRLREETMSRKQARVEAYNAARVALFEDDSTEWDAVPLSSVGHGDHVKLELEL